MRRGARISGVAVAAVLAMAGACGSSGGSGGSGSAGSGGQSVDITAANTSFTPTDIKVGAGKVTFVVKDEDKIEHNLTVEQLKVNKDVEEGKTVKTTVTAAPGTYAFHCEYHPQLMKGTITVT